MIKDCGWGSLCAQKMVSNRLVFGLLATSCLLLRGCTQPAKKKNVLFFAVDDLRPELGTYGYGKIVKSPNIDELASKSIQFERAYCQVAVCSPSRASLLTGRRPDTNHVWNIAPYEYWRNYTNATTIPQYFKENGYISIGMGKIFHPGAPSGHDDQAYSWSPEGLPYYHSRVKIKDEYTAQSWKDFQDYQDNQLPDGDIADNAVSVLQQLKKNQTKGDDRPFFLAVGFHKPHLPFMAPSKYFDMYPPPSEIALPEDQNVLMDMPEIAFSVWGELKNYNDMTKMFPNVTLCETDAKASIFGRECRLPEETIRLLRRAYYACISYTDAQIGRVMKELANQGFTDDTVIVLWADHGWQLGEHNEWCKHTNFEDAVHVPLLLHVPGVTDDGTKTEALVELIDIFPTLTELAGIDTPPLCPEGKNGVLTCVEGSSVAPLLKDPTKQWKKAAFSQYPRPSAGLHQISGHPPFDNERGENVMGYTIRTDQYRFTEWYRFNHTTAVPNFKEIWGTELYDHTKPTEFFNDENTNLAKKPEMKSTVDELRKMLQAGWRAALPPEDN